MSYIAQLQLYLQLHTVLTLATYFASVFKSNFDIFCCSGLALSKLTFELAVPTTAMGRPFPLKIAPSHGGIWTPSNAWFLGPTRVLNPNGISIGAAH